MPSAAPVARKATVPILYYHRVQPVPKDFSKWTKAKQKHFLQYDALPKAFVAQLDWLAANGYTTILPRDLANHWDHGVPLPLKPVIITFDDGSRSWTKRVMQALQQRGMVAEFYLTLDAITADAIDWGDIRQLVAAGNGIGAHDVHHVQIAGLPGGHDPPAATMWKEINDIRFVILANVGVAPDSMAYVGGGYDKTLIGLVAAAGYTTARSINRGVVQTVDRRYSLRVVRIGANDDVLDPQEQTLVPGLPTFAARMRGVSDK
jgi:peptidoglycan/xylan/chitin deacetylase (PgdA/CDA1 family)